MQHSEWMSMSADQAIGLRLIGFMDTCTMKTHSACHGSWGPCLGSRSGSLWRLAGRQGWPRSASLLSSWEEAALLTLLPGSLSPHHSAGTSGTGLGISLSRLLQMSPSSPLSAEQSGGTRERQGERTTGTTCLGSKKSQKAHPASLHGCV